MRYTLKEPLTITYYTPYNKVIQIVAANSHFCYLNGIFIAKTGQ